MERRSPLKRLNSELERRMRRGKKRREKKKRGDMESDKEGRAEI